MRQPHTLSERTRASIPYLALLLVAGCAQILGVRDRKLRASSPDAGSSGASSLEGGSGDGGGGSSASGGSGAKGGSSAGGDQGRDGGGLAPASGGSGGFQGGAGGFGGMGSVDCSRLGPCSKCLCGSCAALSMCATPTGDPTRCEQVATCVAKTACLKDGTCAGACATEEQAAGVPAGTAIEISKCMTATGICGGCPTSPGGSGGVTGAGGFGGNGGVAGAGGATSCPGPGLPLNPCTSCLCGTAQCADSVSLCTPAMHCDALVACILGTGCSPASCPQICASVSQANGVPPAFVGSLASCLSSCAPACPATAVCSPAGAQGTPCMNGNKYGQCQPGQCSACPNPLASCDKAWGPGFTCCSGACVHSAGGSCTAVCGNAVLDPGESCDDGNTASSDGCSSSCLPESGYVCLTPGKPCTLAPPVTGELVDTLAAGCTVTSIVAAPSAVAWVAGGGCPLAIPTSIRGVRNDVLPATDFVSNLLLRTGLATEGKRLYWIGASGVIQSYDLFAFGTQSLNATETSAVALAAGDDGNLYWTNTGGLIHTTPMGLGTAPTQVTAFAATAVGSIVEGGGQIAWAADATVMRYQTGLPSPAFVDSVAAATIVGLALSGNTLYIAIKLGSGANVRAVTLPGTNGTMISTTYGAIGGIAADASGVYVSADTGIFALRSTGTAYTAVPAAGPLGAMVGPLAVDAGYIYYVEGGSRIRRVPKP